MASDDDDLDDHTEEEEEQEEILPNEYQIRDVLGLVLACCATSRPSAMLVRCAVRYHQPALAVMAASQVCYHQPVMANYLEKCDIVITVSDDWL